LVDSDGFAAEQLEQTGFQGQHRSLTGDFLRRMRRHTLAMMGAGIVILVVIVAVAASSIAPDKPTAIEPGNAFQAPSARHIMGTDQFGRDIFSRIIYGARTSLSVGIISVSISLVLGTALGLAAGYYRGLIDLVISRLLDILFAFPPVLLALVMIAMFGLGLEKVMLSVGIVFTPQFARVCRGSVLSEREKLYVEAAKTVGASHARILRSHILPNVMAPLVVQASMCMSWAILAEAALSFLGMGTQPPNPSWGQMLNRGRVNIHQSPWEAIWPGLAIMTVVYAFNVFGDGLRDALDPMLRGRE
jgi:peptide/nickel transport system permease protein